MTNLPYNQDLPEGTVTLLFTDIERSTRLLHRLKQEYAQLLSDQRHILRSAFEKWGGREVDTAGDGFFVSFPTARSAVAASIDAQRALTTHNWPEGETVRVRMGLHTGEPALAEEGYVGTDVHRAARIAQAGHGGQVLLSRVCTDLVRNDLPEGVNLRDLGEHSLKGIPQPEHIFQLVIPGLPADFPALQSLDSCPNNLPFQPSPFIGRTQELAALENLIANPAIHLVTILGPGGMGKTRLALAAAEDQVHAKVPSNGKSFPRFTNGIFFISLASLENTNDIISTIAQAVGFQFYSGSSPTEQLLDYFREKTCLLVMDNFEHLLDGAFILSEILKTASEVKILVTSREKLKLLGETVYPLRGMRVPEEENLRSLTGLQEDPQYCALQLFEQCAQRVRPDLELVGGDQRTAIQICRLLEGMPLGIELATAWLDTLTLEEIAAEIQLDLDFLESERRDAPDRHQSIRAVIDHTWQMLSPVEQDVFKKLSVFRGGFNRQAAQQVSEASLRQLATLVNKSLLSRDSEGRYQIHRLLRRYANDKLDEMPSGSENTRDKHCKYYLDFLHRLEAKIYGGDHLQAWGEIDNIRAAYDWAIKREMTAEMRQAQKALSWLYDHHSWEEAANTFEKAARALETEQPRSEKGIVYGQVLCDWGIYLSLLGRSKESLAILRKSQAVLRQLDALEELARTNTLLGFSTNNLAEAKKSLHDGLVYFRKAGVDWGMTLALINNGYLAMNEGAFQDAESYFQEAMQISRKLNYRRSKSLVLFGLGDIAFQNREFSTAKEYFQECYELSQATANHQYLRNSSTRLGELALLTGEYEEAQRFIQEALQIARDNGNQVEIAWSTVSLGALAFSTQAYTDAKCHYQEALAEFESMENSVGLSIVYGDLSNMALALGDVQGARHYLRQSLVKAVEVQKDWLYLQNLSRALAYIEATGEVERSVEIAALVTNHPQSDAGEIAALVTNRIQSSVFACVQAQKLLDRLKTRLSPDAFTEAVESGKTLVVEATAKGLLEKLGPTD